MSNYFEEARTEACTFLGRELTDAEWTEALPAAQQKLVSIISRYGDSQGDRLAPYYLGKLAEEYITTKALATYCAAAAQKRRPPPKRAASIPPLIYHTAAPPVKHKEDRT